MTANEVEVFRAPVDGAYTSVKRAVVGDHIEPLCLPGMRVAVSAIVTD